MTTRQKVFRRWSLKNNLSAPVTRGSLVSDYTARLPHFSSIKHQTEQGKTNVLKKEHHRAGREGAKPQLCSPGAGLTWPWAVVTGVCLCDCRDGAREERGRREMWKERHPTFRAPLGWRWDVFTQREPQTRMRATAPGPLSRCHSRDEMWSLTPQRAQSGGEQTRGVVGRDDACESTRFG